MLTYLSGLRAIEVASLKVSDVLDEDGNINSRIMLTKHQTKGQQARPIFVSDKLKKELRAYLADIKVYNKDQSLFISQKAPFTRHGICMLLKRIYQDAGVIGASSHSGRRTFATTLNTKSVSVRVIQKLMGHANIGTTQRYIEVSDTQLENAVQLI
ncbi:site-specific integrase [Terasakiella sp. SH-1]|uniref:tyrosine-type recombinase/integrase n=1 Tax=Terasakiella sp. SH-1 TaxID=2560057 RepID=UPI00197F26B3|nr:site-specific integrase [Terasakiella sp. SH-1]